jgi:hypothetical protein
MQAKKEQLTIHWSGTTIPALYLNYTILIPPVSLCTYTQLSFLGVYCKGAQRRKPYTSTNQTWIIHSWI